MSWREHMKVIAFAGMPFSGKSEAVTVAKEMNIPVVRMGDLVWQETKNKGLELNDYNVGVTADNMRKKYGKDIWAKKTLEKIKLIKNGELLIIDGIRNIEEIETFEKRLGKNFTLISIQSTDKLRYKRAMNRGRQDDSKDLKLIKVRDKRELSWGLGNVIASADIVITNQGSIDEFKSRIKDLLNKI
jgi:dephospho-CoA kinase